MAQTGITGNEFGYGGQENLKEVKEIKFAHPGYINIFLNSKYTKLILEDVLLLRDNYGRNESLKNQYAETFQFIQ